MDNDTRATKIDSSYKLVNCKKVVRFYGTTPISFALAKLHNFTQDARDVAYINWAIVKPKIQNMPDKIKKGLEGLMKREEDTQIATPCCGKNFGIISEVEIDLREYGLENRRRVTTVYCESDNSCSLREDMFGMNSCGHYSQSSEIKEL